MSRKLADLGIGKAPAAQVRVGEASPGVKYEVSAIAFILIDTYLLKSLVEGISNTGTSRRCPPEGEAENVAIPFCEIAEGIV